QSPQRDVPPQRVLDAARLELFAGPALSIHRPRRPRQHAASCTILEQCARTGGGTQKGAFARSESPPSLQVRAARDARVDLIQKLLFLSPEPGTMLWITGGKHALTSPNPELTEPSSDDGRHRPLLLSRLRLGPSSFRAVRRAAVRSPHRLAGNHCVGWCHCLGGSEAHFFPADARRSCGSAVQAMATGSWDDSSRRQPARRSRWRAAI